MQGKRIPDRDDGSLDGIQPGDYWRDTRGLFCAALPDPKMPEGDHDRLVLAGLGNHDVTEHEDGTITVSPSILVWTEWGPNRVRHEYWHGFLERGVWRSC